MNILNILMIKSAFGCGWGQLVESDHPTMSLTCNVYHMTTFE